MPRTDLEFFKMSFVKNTLTIRELGNIHANSILIPRGREAGAFAYSGID